MYNYLFMPFGISYSTDVFTVMTPIQSYVPSGKDFHAPSIFYLACSVDSRYTRLRRARCHGKG